MNNTVIIRKSPNITNINSAELSEGGEPVFAMPLTTYKGNSKITPYLKQGAGVTTTRAHVHFVVTAYWVVNLLGKNRKQRERTLISITHPEHSEGLQKKEVLERLGGIKDLV